MRFCKPSNSSDLAEHDDIEEYTQMAIIPTKMMTASDTVIGMLVHDVGNSAALTATL